MRLRYRILLSIPVVILVFVITTYLAIFQFDLIEYVANRELRKQIGDNLPLRVHIGEISGDYYSKLKLRDIYVIYDDGQTIYTLAAVPTIEAEYSIGRFWRGLLSFEKINVESAILTVKQAPDKSWLIPKPLAASKRKGEILEFEVGQLNINNLSLRLYRPEDTLIFSDFTFKARLQGREKTYSAWIENLDFKTNDSIFKNVLASGKITLTGNQLMYQDLSMKTDSSDFTVNGLLVLEDKIKNNFDLNATRLNIAEVGSLVNARLRGNISALGSFQYSSGQMDGNVDFSGIFMERQFDSLYTSFSYGDKILILDTLYGYVLDGCYVNGHASFNLSQKPEKYNYTGTINNFNLINIVRDTYHSNLNGTINVNGDSFRKEDISLDIILNLDESWFDKYHMHKSIGEMKITADSLRFFDTFAFKYFDNTFTIHGSMDYHGLVNIGGHAEFNDLSVFNGQTFIAEMGGRGASDFRFGGRLNDPDIYGVFWSDSLWIYDIFCNWSEVDVNVMRFLYDRDGYINAFLNNGTAYDVPYDTITLQMRVDSQFVFVDSSYIHNQFANISSRGSLDYYNYPQRLALDSVTVNVLGLISGNEDTVVINIDSAGYDFKQCRIARSSGYAEGWGRINYDRSMDFNIETENIDIEPWVHLYDNEYDIKGFISGDASINGTFDNPLIVYKGHVDSLTYKSLLLGNLYADFDYADQEIRLDSINLFSGEGYYYATGMFPIDLAFGEVENRFTEKNQDIEIRIYDNRFDLVSLLMYEVENLTGEFNANFKLTGTPLKPKIDGEASIRNGRLKLYDLVDPMTDLYADLKMINKTVYIDSISAICKNEDNNVGQVRSRGKIDINAIDKYDYDVEADVRNFPIKYELGDITGLVNADLTIRGETPPTVEGDVNIISLTYRENFSSESEGWNVLSALQSENSWDLNLNVDAVSNLWIKNDDIDAEFSGNLNFIRENGRYRYIGQMEILRGKGYWADRTFRIEPGATISYEDIEYPNPTLDIYASTKIRATVPASAGNEEMETTNLDLLVHVTGTLDEPIITTAEGSQYSTEELLPLILLNDYQAGTNTGQRIGDRLTAGLADYVGSQVGRIGSRTLGVETFEIDPVYGDKFDPLGTRLTLGIYTLPNLYIYGRSSISGETDKEFGIEYRLKKFLLMEGRVAENNLYQLILNFHWNY